MLSGRLMRFYALFRVGGVRHFNQRTATVYLFSVLISIVRLFEKNSNKKEKLQLPMFWDGCSFCICIGHWNLKILLKVLMK